MTTENDRESLVLALGEALHRYGTPSHRLEDALNLLSARLGLTARFFTVPTALIVSFGPVDNARTSMVRVQPGEMNLEKLVELHALLLDIVDGKRDPSEARARVADVVAGAPRYGAGLMVIAHAFCAAAAALFFGGRPLEMAVSTAIGLCVGLVVVMGARLPTLAHVMEPIVAFMASAMSVLAASRIPGTGIYLMTLSAVFALLPGLTLTTAIHELASRHLVSGTARLAEAGVHLLSIGFGVALGSRAQVLFPSSSPPPAAMQWPLSISMLAVLVGSASFMVLMRAPPRESPWVLWTCAAAYFGARAGALLFGPEMGAFLGALLVGVLSNIYAWVFRRPSFVTLVPAILLLVPGSMGFRSVFSMVEREVTGAVDAAFSATMVAVALVAGLVIANAATTRKPLL